MSWLTRDGTTEPVQRDRIIRRKRGHGEKILKKNVELADHEQDWQPYPIDPHSAESFDYAYTKSLNSPPDY